MKKDITEKKGAKSKKQKKVNKAAKYLRDLKAEVGKVVWPSKAQVINNTGVVLAAVCVSALFLAGVDTLLTYAVRLILKA